MEYLSDCAWNVLAGNRRRFVNLGHHDVAWLECVQGFLDQNIPASIDRARS